MEGKAFNRRWNFGCPSKQLFLRGLLLLPSSLVHFLACVCPPTPASHSCPLCSRGIIFLLLVGCCFFCHFPLPTCTPPPPPFVAHSSPSRSLFLHFFFKFHFPSRPVDAHILFTRLLSRYSMFPLCFLCCNSQRKARRASPTPPSHPLPLVPALLGAKSPHPGLRG